MNEMKTVDVLIWVVGNGYRVNPVRYTINTDSFTPKEQERVFESFDGLTAYLKSILPVYPVDGPKPRKKP